MSICAVIKNLNELDLSEDYRCPVCLETEQAKEGQLWIYHKDENGKKHPFHKSWCSDYSIDTGKCPACTAALDLSRVFSRAEKARNFMRQISFKSLSYSAIAYSAAYLAAKTMDAACNVFYHSSNCNIGTAVLGFSLGFLTVLNIPLQMAPFQEFRVQHIAKILAPLCAAVLYDWQIAKDDSYAFYGSMTATVLLAGIGFSAQIYRRFFHSS